MNDSLTFERSEVATINSVAYFRTRDNYEVSTSFGATNPIVWVCVSSQAGCRIGCPFCATTGKGFYRSLTGEEIAGQIAFVGAKKNASLSTINFAGIGEPLMNLTALASARDIISSVDLPGLSATTQWDVVTSAYAPKRLPDLFAQSWWSTISVSLHSTTQEIRQKLVPNSRPLDAIRDVLVSLPRAQQARLAFNYLLLKGINDREEDLDGLMSFLADLAPRHILLMRVADVGRGFITDERKVTLFAEALKDEGLPVKIATPSRHQRLGGCGTLKVERFGLS